eukprot:12492286-Alexandrium_andersonii.AAC.1
MLHVFVLTLAPRTRRLKERIQVPHDIPSPDTARRNPDIEGLVFIRQSTQTTLEDTRVTANHTGLRNS